MFVAIGRVVIRIPGARSLKDRRQVVRSYKDRVKARVSVSIAEVGDVENHQLATLGLCAVARDGHAAHDLLEQALGVAEHLKDGIVVDARRKVLPFGEGGQELPGRLGESEEIARAVVFIAADAAGFINGACFDINGGHYMAT